MRPAFAAALLGLFAPACFDGSDAAGMPCREDNQCGRGQSCENNVCGGVPAGTQADTQADTQSDTQADTQSDTQADTQSDTGASGACQPKAPPPWCDIPDRKVENRQIYPDELPAPELTRATAIVAGEFTGDANTDMVVLSLETFRLNMVTYDGDDYAVDGTTLDVDGLTTAYDILASDRDCDGSIEFVVLGNNGHIVLVNWDATNEEFVYAGSVDVATDAYSFAVGDIVADDDGFPDLVVSSNARVSLVTNVGGVFDQQSVTGLMMDDKFYQPWDTLIVDEPDQRIVVPASDGRETMALYNQRVHVLHVAQMGDTGVLENAEPSELAATFRNPWAVAQGDFDGDQGIEIAVAERNVNSTEDGTNEPGFLKFYYLDTVEAFPVWTGGIEIGVGPISLEAADLDCDGRDDLVIGNGGALPGIVGAPQVLYGTADLESATITDVVGVSGAMTPGTRMAVGDFDGDGRPEVAIPDSGDPFGDAGERIVIIDVDEVE